MVIFHSYVSLPEGNPQGIIAIGRGNGAHSIRSSNLLQSGDPNRLRTAPSVAHWKGYIYPTTKKYHDYIHIVT